GGLTPEASITANGGGIKSVTTKGDIQGDVLSSMSIGKVISRTGALTAEASVIANGGDITRASFKTDVDGMLLASESIGNVTGRQGTLRGTLRAGMEISRVKFNDIDSATVSAGGDIGSVLSSNSIVDSALLAGYDIGADGLPGTLDEVFNDSGASIGKIRLNLRTGNFDGTSAAAGVKPFDYDVNTETWTMLAPAGEVQGLASYGKIGPSTVGQVFLNGNPNSGVYGLFAATEAIDRVRFIEVAASGAPDFEIISTW
ncbi:MAG: hypothetical protein K9M57_09085, partial [Phycisphaerae bacterium]|nr:hypothetical protein [Phycisphaerae bacterium]